MKIAIFCRDRPGSAPVLGDVEQFPIFKSDYCTAYRTMEEYQDAITAVMKSANNNKQEEERSEEKESKTEHKSEQVHKPIKVGG